MTQRVSQRLVSLDAFRGLAIAAMVLVNNPGSWDHVYPPLLHAEWNGWTPTDLIFPSFLFIVGVSLVFSLGRRSSERGTGAAHLQVLRRSLVIFFLGLLLNLFPSFDFGSLRVAGVLQRIAIVYGITSLIVLHSRVWLQGAICGGLLLGYWGLMALVPVPGFGSGVLTPEGNLAAYLDSLLLPGRMWEGAWDPEGILSTLPSIATALMGVLTGHWLRSGRPKPETAGWLFVSGWAAIIVAAFWSVCFPINKNIWTSSFAIFAAGASLQALACCYWLMDVAGLQRWAYPLIVFGMNSIALYVLSDLLSAALFLVHAPGQETPLWGWVYRELFASWADPKNASLAFAACYVVFWFAMMDLLYRRRVFIKV